MCDKEVCERLLCVTKLCDKEADAEAEADGGIQNQKQRTPHNEVGNKHIMDMDFGYQYDKGT